MERPTTTLFMLVSLDGKISTGSTDNMDFDKDLPTISGLKEGLHQYYEIEKTTDLWSFNTGRVQSKMGVNDKAIPDKTPVSFILFDNRHLTEKGIEYFLALSKEFVLITTNKNHPAFKLKGDNLHIIYQEQLNMREALQILKTEYGCDELTIQSGGTFNAIFLREKLIDFVNVVLAPVLVGGKDTATLIDGESLSSESELSGLGVLKLIDCKVLQDSYINLRYKVL